MTGRRRTMPWLALAALLISTVDAQAGPVAIQADHLDVWHAKREALFTGRVHLTRDDFELFCDRLKVTYAEKGGITGAVATGHVRMTQGDRRGRADKAVLDNIAQVLTLSGHAVMTRPGGQLEGETIIHHLKDRTTEVRKGRDGRVKLRIDDGGAAGGSVLP